MKKSSYFALVLLTIFVFFISSIMEIASAPPAQVKYQVTEELEPIVPTNTPPPPPTATPTADIPIPTNTPKPRPALPTTWCGLRTASSTPVNVRSQPSEDSGILTTILPYDPPHPILGRTPKDSKERFWYLIREGWVASWVVQASTEVCNDVIEINTDIDELLATCDPPISPANQNYLKNNLPLWVQVAYASQPDVCERFNAVIALNIQLERLRRQIDEVTDQVLRTCPDQFINFAYLLQSKDFKDFIEELDVSAFCTPPETPTPSPTPLNHFERLKLEAQCSPFPNLIRVWRVVNLNAYPVTFTWSLDNSDQHGTVTVGAQNATPGNNQERIEARTIGVVNNLNIYVNHTLVARLESNSEQCPTPIVSDTPTATPTPTETPLPSTTELPTTSETPIRPPVILTVTPLPTSQPPLGPVPENSVFLADTDIETENGGITTVTTLYYFANGELQEIETQVFFPAINFDGTRIAYQKYNSSGDLLIYIHDIDAGASYWINVNKDNQKLLLGTMAWEPDDETLLITMRDMLTTEQGETVEQTNVYRLFTPLNDERVSDDPLIENGRSPAYSPNEEFIAFERVIDPDMGLISLFVRDEYGEREIPVSFLPDKYDDCMEPVFSADSHDLFFVCNGNTNPPYILVVDVGAGSARKIQFEPVENTVVPPEIHNPVVISPVALIVDDGSSFYQIVIRATDSEAQTITATIVQLGDVIPELALNLQARLRYFRLPLSDIASP